MIGRFVDTLVDRGGGLACLGVQLVDALADLKHRAGRRELIDGRPESCRPPYARHGISISPLTAVASSVARRRYF